MNKKAKIMIVLFIVGLMGGMVFTKSCKPKKDIAPKIIKELSNTKDSVIKKINTLVAETPRPSINIKSHQKVSSPLKIEVHSKGLWFASEGELGIVKLIDENKKELAKGILYTTDGNWMAEKNAKFGCTLKFDPKGANNGTLIINNNLGGGSGDEAGISTSFSIPVKF